MNPLSRKFSFPSQSNTEPTLSAVLPVQSIVHDARRAYWLIFFAIVLALLAPIWITRYLPLVDYPHALARGYIAAHYHDVPSFERLYNPPLSIVPNMAFETAAYLFGKWMDVEILGKLFISVFIFLFALGCHAVFKAFSEKPSWLALPAIFFIYSTHLVYGNVNFLLGLSLFLLLFAAWYRWFPTCPGRASLLLLIGAPVLCLVHLSTLAFEWAAIGLVLWMAWWAGQISLSRALGLFSPLLLPLVLLATFLTHGGTTGTIAFNTVREKLLETATLISTYRHGFDLVYLLLLLGVALFVCLRSSSIAVERHALVIGVAFYFLLWVTPGTIFTSSGADVRYLIPSFIFLLASVRLTLSRREFALALGSILVLAMVRIAFITSDWQTMSGWMAPQIALWNSVPEGSRVYPIYYADSIRNDLERKLIPNVGIYAILTRHIYDPAFQALREQDAVTARDGGHIMADIPRANDLTPQVERNILHQSDYLWCYKITSSTLREFAPDTRWVGAAGHAIILQVLNPAK